MFSFGYAYVGVYFLFSISLSLGCFMWIYEVFWSRDKSWMMHHRARRFTLDCFSFTYNTQKVEIVLDLLAYKNLQYLYIKVGLKSV